MYSILEKKPLVSLILLNYNGVKYLEDFLEKCLDSILETNYPNFEIIFVDNNSSDASLDFVKKYFKFKSINYKKIKRIKIIENKVNLIAIGYNEGIKKSRGEYIALISNDMIYHKNWLKNIITIMENSLDIGVAGCKRYQYGTLNIIDGLGGYICLDGRPFTPGNFEVDVGQYKKVLDMDWEGGAAVLRKKVIDEIGLLDPEYIIFNEDTDHCFRIKKRGYRIVCIPDAILWHKTTATIDSYYSNKSELKYFLGERSRIRLAFIHFRLRRIMATIMIDLFVLPFGSHLWKKSVLKAYFYNIINIKNIMKKRIEYGKPLPYKPKYPITPFNADRLKNFMKGKRIA